jgi:hypothetical protein
MITFTTKRITSRFAFLFSYKNSLINTPPEELQKDRPIIKENIWRTPDLSYRVTLLSSRNLKRRISAMASILFINFPLSTRMTPPFDALYHLAYEGRS